jgi:hypothetical protein
MDIEKKIAFGSAAAGAALMGGSMMTGNVDLSQAMGVAGLLGLSWGANVGVKHLLRDDGAFSKFLRNWSERARSNIQD